MKIEIVCSSFSNNFKLWDELIKSYEVYASELLDKFKFTIISNPVLDFDNKSRVNFFYVKEDYGWSENLIKYLEVTISEYILVIYDDVFLKSKINLDFLYQVLEEYKSNKMSFCRLRNSPLTLKKKFNTNFNIIDIDSPYRTVLSFSIVKRDILLLLLDAKENAWDFEYNSPKRSFNINIFESNKNIFDYIHVIEKGGYRFPCLFFSNLKSIRKNYNLFIPDPVYAFKIIAGNVFSKMPYFLKRFIYERSSKLISK